MTEWTISLPSDAHRISDARDEKINPVLTPWHTIAECFGAKSGGDEGWPNGSLILEKANENLQKFPEALAKKFGDAFTWYLGTKNCPLPADCALTDEICKTSNFKLDFYSLIP